MFKLLEIALSCHLATKGLFDPAILPDLEQVGYTKNIDELRNSGAEQFSNIISRSGRSSFSTVELRLCDLSILMPKGMRIDLGGIAKGWIAEQAALKLANFTPNCAVNAGGDMFLIGKPAGMENWEIGLEDPRQPSQDLITILVEEGAVATSSIVKRVWQQGVSSGHHLIDPCTGQPAVTPWLSVTVMAPEAAIAEVYAKAILIGGPDFTCEMIALNPLISFLAVDGEGQIWAPENGAWVRLSIEK